MAVDILDKVFNSLKDAQRTKGRYGESQEYNV